MPAAGQRCIALDAMRGLVMLALCWGLLARGPLAQQPALRPIAMQFYHVPWAGLVFWDLIQPAFWFVVGAALPFALARRMERGATFGQNLRHVCARALKLALLGQILASLNAGRYWFLSREVSTQFSRDTLTQIGFCYVCCFLIWRLPFRWQAITAGMLMAVNWGLYALFPGSAGPFSRGDNIGAVIDRVVFGSNGAAGWVTLNVLGSTVTMLCGVWTGALLMSKRSQAEKFKILAIAMAVSFAAGLALAPVNPVMQKTWTASFTFLSAGFVWLGVGVFYWLFDIKAFRTPAFPLVVVGMNCIFIYVLNGALAAWLDKSVAVFTVRFHFAGPIGPAFQAGAVVLVMWYACYWLYRRKIFLKT